MNRLGGGAAAAAEVDVGLRPIVARVKAELARRGARGIHGLSRRFRSADDDGYVYVAFSVMAKVMARARLRVTARERGVRARAVRNLVPLALTH